MPSGSDTTMPVTATTRVTRQAAPERVSTSVEAEHAAHQQDERDEREDDEERDARSAFLQGRLGMASGISSAAPSRKVRLTRQRWSQRIEAVDELAELRPDERPAGADLAADLLGEAVLAAGPGPHRVDDQNI